MNNSRRNFLRQTALAGAALSMPLGNEIMAMAGKSNPFGIQLWTVKQALYKDTIGVRRDARAERAVCEACANRIALGHGQVGANR